MATHIGPVTLRERTSDLLEIELDPYRLNLINTDEALSLIVHLTHFVKSSIEL